MKKLLLFFMSLFSLLGYSQLSEDFENSVFPPTGWVVTDNGIGTVQSWTRNTALAGNWTIGLASASSRPETGVTGLAQDWLITPQVNVPLNGQVRFFSRSTSAGEAGSVYKVLISTATQNVADFTTTLQTYTELEITNGPMDQKFILLDAYAGQNVYIAFVHEVTNGLGDRWLIDNVNVDRQCLQPDNLTVAAIGDTSVDIGWSNPTGASQWQVEYGPAGFTPGTGTLVTGITSNPYTLTGLTAATTYDYYVRAICGLNNPSPWSESETFTTALCAATQQCDFVFRLTDSFGDGWNGNTMVVRQFGVVVATLGPTFTAGGGPINITVPLCSGQPFELFWNAGGSFANEVGVAIIDPLGTTIFTKAPGTGTPNSLLYSGVAACTPPTCPEPSNVVISGVNTNSGTITWTDNTSGSATQWQVIIQPVGSGYPPSGAEIVNTVVFATNYSFSGLSSNTQYEVYISAICDPSGTPDPSFYEGPINFATTPDYCSGDNFYDAGGPSANYANNSDITWTICPDTPGEAVTVFFNLFNTEQNWDALYVFDGPTTASPQISSGNPAGNVPGGLPGGFWGTTIPGPFVSTHPSGCLTFRFRSDGSVNRPGWDATVVCGPPPTCIAPSGLTVSNLTEDGATFQWTDNNTPPATSWNIVIQPVGSGYPNASAIVIPAGTNPFTVTGLNPNTPYEYYVQSNCGGGDVSFWSGPRTFSTLFPGCGGSEPASNDCPNAPPICNLNGYCGNTSSTYTVNSWPELSAEFCGSIENNSFIKFEAASTSISMNVDVGNCTNGSGIQFMVFQAATCGSGPVTEIGCFFQMNPGVNALTFNGLTPGVTYYLMIDGFAGAVCDYSVTVTSGGSISTDVEITQSNATICVGESFTIDVTGGNGVFNWSPNTGLNATTGNSVIFTPTTPGTYTIQVESTDTNTSCATSDFIEITVLDVVTPSFVNLGPFCLGDPAVTLPTTSGNGVTGLWTLAGNPVTNVDTSVGGNFVYTFTPNSTFQCSPVVTMNIEVLATCTFNSVASAVLIENCETTIGGEFFNTTGSGSDAIGDPTNVFPNVDYGVFVQNSGNLIFRGGELRTFKTPTSNVCGANLYYRIYEASSTPGTFITVPLAISENCASGSYPTTGGTCDANDQKWYAINQVVDLTSNIPGDYILEVYYDFIGDSDSNTGCDETVLVNNAGTNFVANFTIQQPTTFAQTNEECGSSNATITISGFNPGSVYSVTYNDDAIVVGPINYQSGINGDIVLTGLNAGTYSNFNFVINGCSIFEATPITITNFSPSIVGISNNSPICFGNDVIFTVEGTPNFTVNYTINGGISQSVPINASGFATITVVAPASGTVDLTLTNIYNTVCNIVVTNTSSVVVNPLPTATIAAPSSSACIGSDATFIVTGTPNASVTYTVNGSINQDLTLNASGNFTLNISSISDVQVALVGITNTTTGCSNVISAQVANVAIIDVPEATVNIVQPTCAVQQGTIEVTSPLISQINFPGDLFISQVTDAQPGGLTYVEIYNGTGGPVDLSNYRLIIYLNGATTTPAGNNLLLSGTLANDDVVVIRIASTTDEGGVVPDLAFPSASGVNNNDRIVLASAAGVEIDTWGTLDNSTFTPGQGYDYQRITTGTLLPTNTFDNADWTIIDWAIPSSTLGDYSDVGFYTLYASNYEYILSNGTNSITQSTTTFNNVAPGTYTLTVHDTASNCFSDPISITINPAVFNDPITSFTYTTPVCSNNANLLPIGVAGFTTGGQFTSTSGIVISSVTGEIDVMNSSPGTYIITYAVTSDSALCLNAGSSTFEVVISPVISLTLEPTEVCLNAQVDFPEILNSNGTEVLGSWSSASIITSNDGSVDYIFTPSDVCTLPITYTVVTNVCTIQKGISPNGDGLNDSFDLSSFNVRNLQIFNRYGTKVYGRSNYSNEWSGQSDSGNELPTGTYYYVIEFNDSPSKTGWIYINREQ